MQAGRRAARLGLGAVGAILLAGAAGCTTSPATTRAPSATVAPRTGITRDLARLPLPKGKIAVAVYGFRDQTGQYKPAPDSSFSTSLTQGAASILVKALMDSRWFAPVERENLQNLLTERKIVRALEAPQEKDQRPVQIPQLTPASIIIEGGLTAYESNVRTGGSGAVFLGVGLSTQYRVDQVTLNLRSIDIRSGKVLNSVSTTKSIYSFEVRPSVFKFVNFKDLVQFEAGITRNEPAQLCVREALEAAVIHLIVRGIEDGNWELQHPQERAHPLIRSYAAGDAETLAEASDAIP
ncbi:curli production assembly/transport protein CsgG [Massilia sp. CCM 8734]|nr:curli production assembly/transport protein CsgG [Massilia sp. CCM 8734]